MPRAVLALAVFALWVLVTAFSGRLLEAVHAPAPIAQSVSQRLEPGLVIALLLLAAAIWFFRWRDVGLNRPRAGSLKVLWFPGLYIGLFLAGVAVVGLPPLLALAIIAANTAMVGVSEELACRGVLYQGLRQGHGFWMAVLVSTLLFGVVHVLNGFSTGDFASASVQALTAFMSGIAFMGIRLRTGSLWPGMALHGVWNFTLVTMGAGALAHAGGAAQGGISPVTAMLPVLFILPNFLFGLWLLRGAARAEGK